MTALRSGPRSHGDTLASFCENLTGRPGCLDSIDWPPDVFALAYTILEASDACRFVVSPPAGRRWPPDPGWSERVTEAASAWRSALDEDPVEPPGAVVDVAMLFDDLGTVTLRELSRGEPWEACVALLTLHAVADEVCAGIGVSWAAESASGTIFRAKAREMLADRGSLARLSPDRVRIMPKGRPSPTGISLRALARHLCVHGPQVDVSWNKALSRPPGVRESAAPCNILLLPWPLTVHASDFRVRGAPSKAAGGTFEFTPAEHLDPAAVERAIEAARAEAGSVDVLMLPESSLLPDELSALEQLFIRHGGWVIVAGVRDASEDGLGANYVRLSVWQGERWLRYRQDKHHRWKLDGGQILQYHLGAALDPAFGWYEAISVPRRSLHVIDVGLGLTLAPLICEDLARLDPVPDLLRSLAPSLVMVVLLDGPQLASRWTSRYASILADDPGCAVLTLTAYGMVERCRPPGHAASDVVALWKDPQHGLREISLESGAQGVLLTTRCAWMETRTVDGRRHAANMPELTLSAVHQVRIAVAPPAPRASGPAPSPAPLERQELTKLTSWAEALAEVLTLDPRLLPRALAEGSTDAGWRAALGAREASDALEAALRTMRALVDGTGDATPGPLEVHARARALIAAPDALHRTVGAVLAVAIEQQLFLAELRSRG